MGPDEMYQKGHSAKY